MKANRRSIRVIACSRGRIVAFVLAVFGVSHMELLAKEEDNVYYVAIPDFSTETGMLSVSCTKWSEDAPAKSLEAVRAAPRIALWSLKPNIAARNSDKRPTEPIPLPPLPGRLAGLVRDIEGNISPPEAILLPLYTNAKRKSLWYNVDTLNALVQSTNLRAQQRSEFIIKALLKVSVLPKGTPIPRDVASAFEAVFLRQGVAVKKVHYLEQLNLVIIQSNSEFSGLIEAVFGIGAIPPHTETNETVGLWRSAGHMEECTSDEIFRPHSKTEYLLTSL